MVVEDGYFRKEVQNKNGYKWESKFIFIVRDANDILDIQYTLTEILI